MDASALFAQFPSSDPMDRPDFKVIDWINDQFPTEESLDKIDDVMETIKDRISKVDAEIIAAVSTQVKAGAQGKEELHKANTTIETLFEQVKKIKLKAVESERMVQEICKDIKGLDIAKNNLTTTIQTFTQLHNIITQNEQLKLMIARRQYKDIESNLKSVSELLTLFKDYKNVPKIVELQKEADNIAATVKKQVFDEFKDLDVKTLDSVQKQTFNNACLVVDALGPEVTKEFIQEFSNRFIARYNAFFDISNPNSALDKADERFSWISQLLNFYDMHYVHIFPRHWKASSKLAEDLCTKTREALVSQMRAKRDALDANLIKQLVIKSLKLEAELRVKFPDEEEDQIEELSNLMSEALETGSRRANTLPPSKFRGIISSGFDEFLYIYTKYLEGNLTQDYEQILAEDTWTIDTAKNRVYERGNESEMRWVFVSLGDLRSSFISARKKCVELNTGTALFEFFKIVKKMLLTYSKALRDKLEMNDPAKLKGILDENLNTVCGISNTCEVCCHTCAELVLHIKEDIQSHFRDKIEMKNEVHAFESLRSAALVSLVKLIEKKLLPYFKEIPLTNWKEWESLGEQPKYITGLRDDLLSCMSLSGKNLIPSQYQFLIFPVATQIVSCFDEHLLQIRGISNMGAEQLLLDLSLLKAALLKAPAFSQESGNTPTTTTTATSSSSSRPQKSYQKHLEDLIIPVEKQLQIVVTSPDALVHSYKAMAYQPSPAHFVKMMDLKGIPKAEQESYLDEYGVGPSDSIRTLVRNQLAEEGEFGKKLSNLLKIKS